MPSKGKRSRNLYDPSSAKPFKLSRSKLDLFLECPRCFYLDRKLGVGRPAGPPFTLNSAVDALLKKEFDIHRAASRPHPLMTSYGIDAIPMSHEMIDEWRSNFKGVTYHHPETNFIITGAIDDIWINPQREFIIVDYKATSKNGEVALDQEYHEGYKRQAEIYQWLFRRNGFEVNDTAYFVYANGIKDRKAFDGKLEFDVKIIPYQGDDSWVEKTVKDAYQCLQDKNISTASEDCDFCAYRRAAADAEGVGRLF